MKDFGEVFIPQKCGKNEAKACLRSFVIIVRVILSSLALVRYSRLLTFKIKKLRRKSN